MGWKHTTRLVNLRDEVEPELDIHDPLLLSRQHDGDNPGGSSRLPFFQEDSQGGT